MSAPAAVTLDLTGITCPMTFVRVTVALEPMAAGDRLEVILDAGEPSAEVPRSAALHGHVVETTERLPNGQTRVRLRKA